MASASALRDLYQGVEKGSFGYKMLATMGWKEGQGLGANKQGITEHVKVKKKQDALGVGAAERAHKLRDWTTGMVGFDAILTGLKEVSRAPHSSGSSDGSSGSEAHESGYDSDSDTSGGADAAAAKKGSSKQKGSKSPSKKRKSSAAADEHAQTDSRKKQKTKKHKQETAEAGRKKAKKAAAAAAAYSSSSDSSSSESESDSDSDNAAGKGAAPPARVSRVTAATHIGRYQKREKAKTVRNYSANDLAAILGLPGSAPVVPNGEGAAGWAAVTGISNPNGAGAAGSSSSSDSGSSSSSDDSDSDTDQEGSEQRLRPGTPPGSDTPPVRADDEPQQQQQQQGLSGGSSELNPAGADDDAGGSSVWWRSVFVKAGRGAGSVGPSGKTRINISGFQEDDQTNLYMQAHEAAVKNKQGLGRAAMPKKVAGARWQGKKTKLGSDDEDDEQQQQQDEQLAEEQQQEPAAAATGHESYTKNGITIVMPVKRDQQQPEQQEQQISKLKQREPEAQQQQQQNDSTSKSKKRRSTQEQANAEVDQSPAAVNDSKAKKSRKTKQQQQQEQPTPTQAVVAEVAAAAAAETNAQKVRWAKLAAKILEGAPKKRMRVQKLHKKVVAAAGFDADAPGVDSEALYKQMLKKLRKAEGLEVCEKYVAMA